MNVIQVLRSRKSRPLAWVAGLFVVTGMLAPSTVFAQENPQHLNPVIERLAAGQPFFGVSTQDLSVRHARSLAAEPIQYVYVDMEHGAMDFTALHLFSLGLLDKRSIAARGNAQADVAVFARFPPYGRDVVANEWVVKQALDHGLMGIIFNSIDNAEQATAAVSSMRYPQQRGSEYPEPVGVRGSGAGAAAWWWGVSGAEYRERADVWPLNPNGDLLAIMMVETAEGLRNVDEIASVPGVGAIFVGPADLALSLGVPGGDPQIEEALQTILAACLAHDVACGKSMSAGEMAARLEEGWKMINLGGANGGLSVTNHAALRVAQEALGE